jgi:hypothetical protein
MVGLSSRKCSTMPGGPGVSAVYDRYDREKRAALDDWSARLEEIVGAGDLQLLARRRLEAMQGRAFGFQRLTIPPSTVRNDHANPVRRSRPPVLARRSTAPHSTA